MLSLGCTLDPICSRVGVLWLAAPELLIRVWISGVFRVSIFSECELRESCPNFFLLSDLEASDEFEISVSEMFFPISS